MDKKIASIFEYFAIFEYFPSFEEVYTFFPEKISKKRLKTLIEASKYTLPQYGKKISNIKYQISKRKLKNWRFRAYIKLISLFPQIKLIGLSGSISMMNAKDADDIDLFIITAKNRLFTGRFIALALAQILGLRRGFQINQKTEDRSQKTEDGKSESVIRHPSSDFRIQSSDLSDKVCLNLFFDEANLTVPKRKQTLFVGHEVLQMKPIIVKDNIYERFLKANLWIKNYFPNSVWKISNIKYQRSKINSNLKFFNFKLVFDICALIFNLFEIILKSFQLSLINKHKTSEIVTSTQLWFHPDDFEKKIKLP